MSTQSKLYRIRFQQGHDVYELARNIQEVAGKLRASSTPEIIEIELWDDCHNMDALQRINHCKAMNGEIIGE